MRAITKDREPPSLTRHRQMQHCDYANFPGPDKGVLRDTLVNEQGGVCCYCMGRIRNEHGKTKIEHWQCQSRYPQEQLNYRNLLGACPGGEGQPSSGQHCDTRKGDRDLLWNPADPDHHIETRLRYETDGRICSDNEQFNEQLVDVLNLNLPILRNQRKGVLDAILEWWRSERKRKGAVPRAQFERKLKRYMEEPDTLAPYCQVAVWWLEQHLERMAG